MALRATTLKGVGNGNVNGKCYKAYQRRIYTILAVVV